MCGRYEQHLSYMRRWVDLLGDWPEASGDRFNVCPTQMSGTIDAEGYSERQWSLIPQWSQSAKLKYSTFNARSEAVATKTTFRHAWKRSQRCIVPVSRYFEWIGTRGSKQCHAVQSPEGLGLGLAGLWERWSGTSGGLPTTVDSFTILTKPAAEEIEWLHHRMPVMLDADRIDLWLTGSPEDAAGVIQEAAVPTGVQVLPVDSPIPASAIGKTADLF